MREATGPAGSFWDGRLPAGQALRVKWRKVEQVVGHHDKPGPHDLGFSLPAARTDQLAVLVPRDVMQTPLVPDHDIRVGNILSRCYIVREVSSGHLGGIIGRYPEVVF